MNILLLSMPDSFEHTPPIAIRMPNGALASLAGNVDPHHQRRRRRPRAGAVVGAAARSSGWSPSIAARRRRPLGDDVPALDRAAHHRAASASLQPDVRVVVGGYDPSLAPEAWTHPGHRRRRHRARRRATSTFRELLRALETRRPLDGSSPALWCRDGGAVPPQPGAAGRALGDGEHRAAQPRRARALAATRCSGRQVDVVETSRGCTFDCSFCSIIEMRGRNFHRFPIERVIADIADAARAARAAIFIVDDNITLDVRALRGAVPAIIDAG